MAILGGIGTLLGTGGRRRGADAAQPPDHVGHAVLAAGARRGADRAAVRVSRRHRRRARPPLRARLARRPPCLRCADLRRVVRRRDRDRRRQPRGRAPRDRRDHRPERRRQVDAVQPHHRPPAGRRGQRAPGRARRHRHGAAPALRARRRPLVPAHEHLPAAQRVRERAGGADRAPRPRPRPVVARRRTVPRRGRSAAARREPARPREHGRRRAVARQPEAARARHRAGGRARAPAARRAHRRHVGSRDARFDGAAAPDRGRARPDAALHRARHGRRVLDRAPHRGAAPGPGDRRRTRRPRSAATPRCGASISETGGEPAGPPRANAEREARSWSNERGARSRLDPHLLRAVARAVRRVARGGARPVRVPARPQRRGQDDGHALDHGSHAARAGARAVEGRARSPAGGPTASRAPASASCPRTAACSPS